MPVAPMIAILVVLIIAVAVSRLVAKQPTEMVISRELKISAPPELIFPYINNSKLSNEWMPWKESDPKMVMTYSGPDEGVGSGAFWQSTGRMGIGNAVIIESVANSFVKTRLTYTKPMQMQQMAEVSLIPSGDQTTVRWLVKFENRGVGRIFCLVINMDKMVGGQFDIGLRKLRTLIENSHKELRCH